MRIHTAFSGGNIVIEDIINKNIFIKPDLRDTTIPWFYWCFCVQGAQGQTLNFRFPANCVGPFGAAVSSDLLSWRWSHSASEDENGFSYTFTQHEERVYFCHDMRYSTERFESFAREKPGLTRFPFAESRKCRTVWAYAAGEGDEWLVLASRHHCCESTGTYLMEGAVAEYLRKPLPGVKLLAVPFMDLDGVEDGDPGKSRAPHDHNRDYVQGLYPEVRAMMHFGRTHSIRYFFDLHSPWHKGGRNDTVFLVTPSDWMASRVARLGQHMREAFAQSATAMRYDPADNMPWNVDWNIPAAPDQLQAAQFFGRLPGIRYASTLETAYFGTEKDPVSQEKLVASGACLMQALRKMNEEGEIA